MKFVTAVFFVLILSLIPASSVAQEAPETHSFDPTFTHVVYFWLKNPDDSGQRTQFETALRKLFRDSRYTKTNFLGVPPRATREVVDDSFTYAMIVTFDSAAAQTGYQQEQAHQVFREETAHLISRFVVYDAEGLKP